VLHNGKPVLPGLENLRALQAACPMLKFSDTAVAPDQPGGRERHVCAVGRQHHAIADGPDVPDRPGRAHPGLGPEEPVECPITSPGAMKHPDGGILSSAPSNREALITGGVEWKPPTPSRSGIVAESRRLCGL